jgi:hypothetical protein
VTGPATITTAAGAASAGRRDVVAVGLIATVLAAAAVAWWFGSVVAGPVPAQDPALEGRRLAAIYDPPDRAIEAAINKGDGQLFAALATDPAVRRPEQVRGSASEQAYRYQRMGYGWLGWAASGGQAEAVPWALVAVTVGSVGLLVTAAGTFLLDRGADPRLALLVAVQPAVFIDLTWIGPEVLGTTLVLAGLVAWTRRATRPPPSSGAPGPVGLLGLGRTGAMALACFAAAGLLRETLLLVPAALVLFEAAHRRWRPAVGVALAAVPYVAWVLVLRAVIGAWPSGSVDGRLSLVPFGGMALAIDGWSTGDAVAAGLIFVPAAAAIVLTREVLLRLVLGAHLVLAATMGEAVWARWPDFTRVLLPLSTLAIVVVAAEAWLRRSAGRALDVGNAPLDPAT